MSKFRTIDYGRVLYETLRYYFAVNSEGELSILYNICAAIVQPLQPAFDAYHLFRITESIIASCLWQIGQLTNVLNYLYDSVQNRIFITQSTLSFISDPTFPYTAIHSDPVFGEVPAEQERVFGDLGDITLVTINIPASVNLAAITSTIEQIKLEGIPYQIVVF